MQGLRQFGMAIVVGIISLGLVVGGFSLALSESFTQPLSTPTENLPTAPVFLTATLTPAATLPPTELPTLTNTPLPPPACIPPSGWMAVAVQPGDTLAGMAVRYNTTPAQLSQANCLLSETLVPGTTLFVPPILVNNTPIPCGPPFGWMRYTVQPGDTLFRIATMYGTTVGLLQQSNCLGNSTAIRAGQLLWVPNVPPRTPIPSNTPGVTLVPDFSTSTSTEVPPTEPLTETPPPPTSTSAPTSTTAPTEPPPASPTLTPFPP